MNRKSAFVWVLGIALAGCGGDSTGPDGPDDHGVDLDAVFAPPTPAEIAAIEADWASRSPAAEGVREDGSWPTTVGGQPGRMLLLSHLVDGFRHYGLVIVPDAGPRELPVIVFGHPGDAGVSTTEVSLLLNLIGAPASNYAFVIPSFRSEPIIVSGTHYLSEGTSSPWDRDVDDALALLDAALKSVPEADPERIGVIGFSRGAGVGLLMGIRDPRIDLVVEFAGPTDFFSPYVRTIVEDAFEGKSAQLPGFVPLNLRFIQPLIAGTLSIPDFRLELVRRSATVFASRLPPIQIHHGTADNVVSVSQAELLEDALDRLARPEGQDELYIYQGAGHSPLGMIAAPARAVQFLEQRLLSQPTLRSKAE